MAKADGAGFLGKNGGGAGDLLQELEAVAGRDHRLAAEKRVGRLEEAMQSMYASMTKDSNSGLDAAGVRYMLHRLFVQRHGWFVEGLDHGGDAWNASSPTAVFEKHSDVHSSLFEEKFNSRGFTLHQIAVFAATLETLVHSESVERLQVAARLLGLSPGGSLDEHQAKWLLRGYMLIYTGYKGTNLSALSSTEFDKMSANPRAYYSTFADTETFANTVRQRVLEDMPSSERNSWGATIAVVEEIAERYGRWQDKECHDLKSTLLKVEMLGTGRVRVGSFYSASGFFSESQRYLRQLGALDESDPQHASVIISNYLNSPANCVATSRFYSVCCIDECDSLLASLEDSIAAPEATPERIIELVAALPSDTVAVPRTLPITLTSRLEEIAAHHGGRVPLHGRLFTQWLHHAYPLECPFPHVSGTTKRLTATAWTAFSGMPVRADTWEKNRLIVEAQAYGGMSAEKELQWTVEEELFISQPKVPEFGIKSGRNIVKMFLAAPLLAVAVMVLRSYVQEAHHQVDRIAKCSQKYYV